jgi:AGCS family alanine or glycine:cation symporter
VICTSTAFIILVSGPEVYDPANTGGIAGATLTQAAVAAALGSWSSSLMTFLITIFAFSSVLGNYSYAEVNLFFLGANKTIINLFRIVVLLSIAIGAIAALAAVWAIADIAMAFMAIVNLVAISLLGKWAFGAFQDYQRQEKLGQDPIFVADQNTDLPGELPGDVWTAENGRTFAIQSGG